MLNPQRLQEIESLLDTESNAILSEPEIRELVAMARAATEIAKVANIHVRGGSDDDYGHGLYNGLMTAIAIIENDPACVDRTVRFEDYRAMNRAALGRADG